MTEVKFVFFFLIFILIEICFDFFFLGMNLEPLRCGISITPEMIRDIVKKLQMKRVYVPSSLILNHLQLYYPTGNKGRDNLRAEVRDSLITAVNNGYIIQWGNDNYCIPTLRHEAMSEKSKFSDFNERFFFQGKNAWENLLSNFFFFLAITIIKIK